MMLQVLAVYGGYLMRRPLVLQHAMWKHRFLRSLPVHFTMPPVART